MTMVLIDDGMEEYGAWQHGSMDRRLGWKSQAPLVSCAGDKLDSVSEGYINNNTGSS